MKKVSVAGIPADDGKYTVPPLETVSEAMLAHSVVRVPVEANVIFAVASVHQSPVSEESAVFPSPIVNEYVPLSVAAGIRADIAANLYAVTA